MPTTAQNIKNENDGEEIHSKHEIKSEQNFDADSNEKPINVIITNSTSSSLSTDFFNYFEVNSSGYYNGQSGRESPPPTPPPLRPRMTFLEATEPVKLPNGVTLPSGTKQIIVHPYNRPIYWKESLL